MILKIICFFKWKHTMNLIDEIQGNKRIIQNICKYCGKIEILEIMGEFNGKWTRYPNVKEFDFE